MTRRALLVTVALCAIVCAMASGAWAANLYPAWAVHSSGGSNGFMTYTIEFTPSYVDTSLSAYLGEEGDKVNDSIVFYSPPFSVATPWTVCNGRMFWSTQDTVSTIDSVGYALQSKFAHANDSTWWVLATCAKADEDLINTNPASADIKAYFDADSVGVGDWYRLQVALMAEEAQWRAKDSSGILPFNAKYIFYLMFVDKGNQ